MIDGKMICLTVDFPEDPLLKKYKEKACNSANPTKMLLDELYLYSSVLQHSIKSSNSFMELQNKTPNIEDENTCNTIVAILEVLSEYINLTHSQDSLNELKVQLDQRTSEVESLTQRLARTETISTELARYTAFYLEQEAQIKELTTKLAQKDTEIRNLSTQLSKVNSNNSGKNSFLTRIKGFFISMFCLLFFCSPLIICLITIWGNVNNNHSSKDVKNYYPTSYNYHNSVSADSGMVWIDDTAKKYHAKNGCNMDNPYQVTLEEAESMGREPCGRCY